MKHNKYLRFGRLIYKIFSCCILINGSFFISLALAEDYKSQISSEKFKEVYFKGDPKYEDVDSFNNQMNLFFGIDNSLEKKSFKDLALPLFSSRIRQLYDDKLNQMYLKKNHNLNEFFFKERL